MTEVTFQNLDLSPEVLESLNSIGYEKPSPIQAEIIPHILKKRDVIGQAQTGTGKTAAFALPILSNIDVTSSNVQVLVLAPTRELAIQVAEAIQKYASKLKGFHVLPIYGGTGYESQLRNLKKGVQIVVGTPGRVCDHIRKGTLSLDHLQTLVLDEADEMLRMGFIEEVEWVLERTPEYRQVALFSATMPKPIRGISKKYLHDPVEITIESKAMTASTVRQRYWIVSGVHKLDALTRILEGEEIDGMIVFVRTKSMTVELAERLQARGFDCAALNGDIAQNQREDTVRKLKAGKIDIIVATDVAARGLDVSRVSHVMNYDIPYDTESYVHRIGRTGRAGKSGEAILFVAPREKRLLASIEKATGQPIELMQLPSHEFINNQRIEKFKLKITEAIAQEEQHQFFMDLIENYRLEFNIPAIEIAAALAKMLNANDPLILEKPNKIERRSERKSEYNERQRGKRDSSPDDRKSISRKSPPEEGYERYVLNVGSEHGAKPGSIVGAIANEAGLEGKYIRKLKINRDKSFVDLPEDMPKEVQRILQKTMVAGQPLKLRKWKVDGADFDKSDKKRFSKGKKFKNKKK